MTVALVVGITLIVVGLMLHVQDAGPRVPRRRPPMNHADEDMLALFYKEHGGI